jgi:Holliday junction resolvase RusA-like endonuclease
MTRSDRWKHRDCVDRYFDYKDRLRAAWGDRPVQDILDIVFIIPMSQSWSKKKRSEMDGKPHQSKPDIDNLLKGFMDALLDDDARIWKVCVSKIWGYEGGIDIKEIDSISSN